MKPDTEWQLSTHTIGHRVLVYQETDSTNNRCAELARDLDHHGTVILAYSQTAGRGQHGRTWLTDPGSAILLSVLLFPPPSLRRPAILTAWAAVSVCELLREIGTPPPTIKWPNDILIQGRKVCGILIEQTRGVITGIGLNVNQSREMLDEHGLNEAASMSLFSGEHYAIDEMAQRLIHRLDVEYSSMVDQGIDDLERRWKDDLGLVDDQVIVEGYKENLTGLLVDVSFDGIALDIGNHIPIVLPPEAVKHIYRTGSRAT